MHGLGRKRGQADGDVFRTFGMRRAVLHPFTGVGDNSLPGLHVEHTIFVRHTECALEHNGEFIEFRCLARFDPTARTAHVRNAESRFAGVHPSNELLDDFRFVARRGDAGGSSDKRWHCDSTLRTHGFDCHRDHTSSCSYSYSEPED